MTDPLSLPGGWKENKDKFLHVGPPHDRLYKQGICRVCKITMFGKLAAKRIVCGNRECQDKFAANPHKYPEWQVELMEQSDG